MPKTRLNRGSRDAALEYIKANLTTPKEQKRYDKAVKRAYEVIVEAANKKFPPADMDVLAKYNQTRGDTCGAVVTPSGQVIGFELPAGFYGRSKGPWYRADDYPAIRVPRGSCNIRNLKTTETGGRAVAEYDAATQVLTEARTVKLRDYAALIEGARYIEDVVDVVPELTDTLDGFKSRSTALTVSGEVLDRIRADKLSTPTKENEDVKP